MKSMERNIVVYFGILFLPDKNALCQRMDCVLKSVEQIGYKTVVIGMNKELLPKVIKKKTGERVCYEVGYPSNIIEWGRQFFSARDVLSVLQDIGKENIRSLIVADYRFFPMQECEKFCKKNSINFVIDIMDWFIPEMRLLSLPKQLDNWLRINVLYPRAERKICICENFAKKYSDTKYVTVIPGTVDINDSKWKKLNYESSNENIKLVFAGQAGKHCKKERLDWVIRAISEEKIRKKMSLYIIGISFSDFFKNNPNLKKYIKSCNIHFLGKMSHPECLKQIANSDFSLVIRKKNKLSEFGFSTKISESFACGTPVLATKTSDICKYVKDEVNGFVSEASYEEVKKMLLNIAGMDKNDIIAMRESVIKNNDLIYDRFTEQLRKVI